MLRVHTVLYDGVEEMDFVFPAQILGAAPGVEHAYVTAEGPRTVTAAGGLAVAVHVPWSPEDADLLLVPGGRYGEGSAVAEQIRLGVLPKALADAQRPGLIMAAVCTGTMLLSAAGITAGRACTSAHAVLDDLRAEGGNVVRGRVVDDGDLVTCGGITSGIDLALWLTERLIGVEAALFAETMLEYERRGTVWRSA